MPDRSNAPHRQLCGRFKNDQELSLSPSARRGTIRPVRFLGGNHADESIDDARKAHRPARKSPREHDCQSDGAPREDAAGDRRQTRDGRDDEASNGARARRRSTQAQSTREQVSGRLALWWHCGLAGGRGHEHPSTSVTIRKSRGRPRRKSSDLPFTFRSTLSARNSSSARRLSQKNIAAKAPIGERYQLHGDVREAPCTRRVVTPPTRRRRSGRRTRLVLGKSPFAFQSRRRKGKLGVPTGIRTRVFAVKGRRARPLHNGDPN